MSNEKEQEFLNVIEMASSMPQHMLLKMSAANNSEKIAVVDVTHDKRCTYSELWDRTNRLGNALLDLGIQKGDHLAVFSDDYIEVVEILYGASKTGTVWTILNARYMGPEAEYQINHSDAKVVFLGPGKYVDVIQSIRPKLEKVKHFIVFGDKQNVPNDMHSYEELLSNASNSEPDVQVTADDWDSLAYTSGTTGKPSASLRTHRAGIEWELTATMGKRLGTSMDINKVMGYYPFYHWGGPVSTRPILAKGGTRYLITGSSLEKMVDTIEKERVESIAMIPVMTARLLSLPGIEKRDLSSIKSWGSSGAAFNTSDRERLKQLIPNAVIGELYSSTEGVFASADLPYLEEANKVRCSGLPPYGVECKILDENFNEVPRGEIGKIFIKGTGTHNTYFKNEEKNKHTRTPDGEWLTSEDLGFMDQDGFVYVADRARDVINTAGELVQSLEVENILSQHPKIDEVAVVSSPDPIYQERVTAVVVLKPGETASADEIKEWSRDKMASFKLPRKVDFVPEIPKVGPNKMDKKTIRDWYWKGKFKV